MEYKIVHKKVRDLVPYDENPRIISEKAKKGLGESIRIFGLVDPIVVNKTTGRVVGGHQRLRELAESGVEETDVLEGEMSETEEIALNIALNSEQIRGTYEKSAIKMLDEIHENLTETSEKTLLDELREQLGGKPKKDKKPKTDKEPKDHGEPDEPEEPPEEEPKTEKIIPPFTFLDMNRDVFKKADYDAFTILRDEQISVAHPATIKCLVDWFCPSGGVPGASNPDFCRVMALYSDKVACLGDEPKPEPPMKNQKIFRADDAVFEAIAETIKQEKKVVAFGTFYGKRLDYLTRMAKVAEVELHLLEKYKEHPKIQQAIYAGVKAVFHFTEKDVENSVKNADGWVYDVEDPRILEAASKRFNGVWGERAVIATTDGISVAALAKVYGRKILAVCVGGDVSERIKRLTTPEEFERIEIVCKEPGESEIYEGIALTPNDACAKKQAKAGDVLVITEKPEKADLKSGEFVKGKADFILGDNPKNIESLKDDRFFALINSEIPNARYWTQMVYVENGKIQRINVYFKGEIRKIKNVFPGTLSEALEDTFIEDENETKGLLYELFPTAKP